MKKNDFLQIKNLEEKQLLDKVHLLNKEIAELVWDKNMNKLKDTKSIFRKRKNLAQVMTILRQKQLISQLSVVSKSVKTEEQITGKPKSENKKLKTDNRKGSETL